MIPSSFFHVVRNTDNNSFRLLIRTYQRLLQRLALLIVFVWLILPEVGKRLRLWIISSYPIGIIGDVFIVFLNKNHSLAQNKQRQQQKRQVSFGNIEIYEFQQILGDHPCVNNGVPIALCTQSSPIHFKVYQIDQYEIIRQKRQRQELLISPIERQNM